MKKELSKHKLAYLVLVTGLALFLVTFLGFWPARGLQRIAVVGLMCFYFIWGITTHVKTETLSKRVAVEYAAVSLFGGFVLLMLVV